MWDFNRKQTVKMGGVLHDSKVLYSIEGWQALFPKNKQLKLDASYRGFRSHPIILSTTEDSSLQCLLKDQELPDQETKAESTHFPKGLGWKVVIKSGATPREDPGEEPSWVYEESHMTRLPHLSCIQIACHSP